MERLPPEGERPPLRVATLNLWGWFGDWPARLRRLERDWPRLDPDVLLVQEASTTPRQDQIADTAEALGYGHVVQGACHSDKLGTEGLAIMSRLPLLGPRVVDLPASRPARCLLVASVEVGGVAIELATSHTVVRPTDLRERQLDRILGLEATPLVVGGDFNAGPGVVGPLATRHGLTDPLDGSGAITWPISRRQFIAAWTVMSGEAPLFRIVPGRIDYLLHRGLVALDAGVCSIGDPPDAYASDHAAVWTDYRT
jgi:endonuclease/exonuclease/phosphatase family metal-dependent hydrolase